MIRSLIVINNSTAPKEYTFQFKLEPGCKIVSGFDHKASDESRLGYLYVVDKNTVIHDEETKAEYPETIFYIEPAWAKDAEGKSVPI